MSVPTAATGVLIDRAAAAPAATIDDLLAPRGALLVIAPHPDDETLGCGAAIAAALARGVPVTVALLTDGDASHPGSRTHPPAVLAALRRAEFAAALAALGAGAAAPLDQVRLGLADTAVEAGIAQAFEVLAAEAERRDVATLWCTCRANPNADHVAAAAIADGVCARRHLLRRDYAVWARFGTAGRDVAQERLRRFEPGRFAAAKRAAMACYPSQLTGLIADDPAGFVMPPALVAHFAAAPEIFLA